MRSKWHGPVFLVLASLVLSGCGLIGQSSPVPTLTTATAPLLSPVPTSTETAEVTNCAFVWSTRSLPEVSLQLNQAFRQSAIAEVEAQASAYGEDCIDQETNQVVRFLAAQTDFYFNVAAEQTDDPQVLGEWVENIMRVLDGFPPGQVPGPNPGLVEISFNSGAQTTILRFQRTAAESLLKDGLRGSALFEALQNP